MLLVLFVVCGDFGWQAKSILRECAKIEIRKYYVVKREINTVIVHHCYTVYRYLYRNSEIIRGVN